MFGSSILELLKYDIQNPTNILKGNMFDGHILHSSLSKIYV